MENKLHEILTSPIKNKDIERRSVVENYIPISFLNDFIFCPRSVYFHQVYSSFDTSAYHEDTQTKGRMAHLSIDRKKYSTKKDILQGMSIYSSEHSLCGRIDIFDAEQGILIERKKLIKKIYDGFVFQMYAQYYCLKEMGYSVKKLCLRSLDDNQNYFIPLPENSAIMKSRFQELLEQIRDFDLEKKFSPNPKKCAQCVYKNLCDYGPVSC